VTAATDAVIPVEPVVHRKLRRRPPASIRNGRALMLSIGGYAVFMLTLVAVGILVGAKGAVDLILPTALVTLPLTGYLILVVRLTKTRQKWAFALAILTDAVLAIIFGYLIVTMETRFRDPNLVFFVQLALTPGLLFALSSAWHFTRGFSWFNGVREQRLRPEETGARPIATPLIASGPAAVAGAGGSAIEAVAAEAVAPTRLAPGQPLLTVQGLKKHFPIYGGVLRKQIGTVYAVDGVDFEIMPGETFSLVGESGCGKTTLGRTIIQLTPSTDGRVVFDGYELADVDPDDMRPLRRRMQIIFQDPFGSLNPRMPVSDLIGEGLLAQGLTDRATRDKRVEDSLELVGLRREYTRRYPHEFSGGQRQRIGVARALALGPDFIVADEPVSALDVSIQSQVLNLLLDLKRELNLTYLFISHNLSVVQYFSDRVGVMYLGKIAEIGTVDQLYHDPRHPYTVSLLSAIPEANPRRRKSRIVLKGDVPSPAAPPSGCRFHTRCWLRERLGNPENCSTVEPQLRTFGQDGHQVACHWAEEVSPTTVAQAAAETPAIVAAATDDA
jgi:oligopeptide/dipeptide ABC transporter ATP-binding protein